MIFSVNNYMKPEQAIKKIFDDIRHCHLTEAEMKIYNGQRKRGVRIDFTTMDLFLRKNLVELVFDRKIPKQGFKKHRHMLCTRNFYLAEKLAKIKGKSLSVSMPLSKNYYRKRSMLLVWDIVFNDWRMISLENKQKFSIIDYVPFKTKEQYKPVAEVYVKDFKVIRDLNSTVAKSYCNTIRQV